MKEEEPKPSKSRQVGSVTFIQSHHLIPLDKHDPELRMSVMVQLQIRAGTKPSQASTTQPLLRPRNLVVPSAYIIQRADR
jgi:hypothetical protein